MSSNVNANAGPSSGANASQPVLHVVFKVAGAEYVLPVSTVVQMDAFTGATRVPGAPPWVAGIVQVRGRVVPVIDLRVRFGLPPIQPGDGSRVVIGELDDRTVALAVDSARDVVMITAEQAKPPPSILEQGVDGFVRAVAQIGPRMLLVLDFARVIGQEPLDVA